MPFSPTASIDCGGTITWSVTVPELSGFQLVGLIDQSVGIGPVALTDGGTFSQSTPGYDPLAAHTIGFQLKTGDRVRASTLVAVTDACEPAPPTTVAPPATEPAPPTTDTVVTTEAPVPPTEPAPTTTAPAPDATVQPTTPPATDPPATDPPATTTVPAEPASTAPVPTSPPTTAVPATTEPAPPSSLTFSPAAPRVGQPVTFDGSALTCDPVTACGYSWEWFYRSADGTTTFTGGQMGLTPTVSYTFDSFAASKPFVIVTLTVSEGRVGPRHTYSTSFIVQD